MSIFGQIIQAVFPERKPAGHEQHGIRPALVISDPSTKQKLESPMLIVAPITTKDKKAGAVRVKLEAGEGGVPDTSTILCDQITALDVSRIRNYYGRLEGAKLEEAKNAVKTALADLLETE